MKSSPLIAFLIASAGIHAGVVATSNSSFTITLPASTESVMAIRVIENTPEKQKNKPVKKIVQSNKKVSTRKNTISKFTKSEVKKEQVENKPTPSVRHNAKKTQAHVASILIKEFNQYFIYPKLAVKRNWQGKVLLSLHISSSGTIKNIYINASSGYSVLDEAAINAMRKVKALPHLSSWLEKDVELELPIIYRLTEG